MSDKHKKQHPKNTKLCIHIQPVAAFPGASLKHDLGRSSIAGRIESSGYDHGNTAACYLDGVPLDIKSSRGLSITVLEPTRLLVLSSRAYDIWESYGEGNQLVADLEALPSGHIVLAALKDSGMEKLSLADWKVLQDLGSMFTSGQWRQGYALIGTKGGKAVAEAQGQAVTITGTIFSSIPSPQGLTLKLKHNGVFHRFHIHQPLDITEFDNCMCCATGRRDVAGLRAVYIDEEGDRCIVNKDTLLEFFQADSNIQ